MTLLKIQSGSSSFLYTGGGLFRLPFLIIQRFFVKFALANHTCPTQFQGGTSGMDPSCGILSAKVKMTLGTGSTGSRPCVWCSSVPSEVYIPSVPGGRTLSNPNLFCYDQVRQGILQDSLENYCRTSSLRDLRRHRVVHFKTYTKRQVSPIRKARPFAYIPEDYFKLSLRYTLPSFSSMRVALRTLAHAALLPTLSMSAEIAATCALIWLMSSVMIEICLVYVWFTGRTGSSGRD